MTKKHFLPSIVSISICSLALSNCASIAEYRKDPSQWTNSKSNANPAAGTAEANPAGASTTGATATTTNSLPDSANQRHVRNQPLLPIGNAKKDSIGVKNERRKVGGLLTPNHDKLPTQKDLQEVQSSIPSSGNSNGVKIPVKP